jgi:hypothetical protein
MHELYIFTFLYLIKKDIYNIYIIIPFFAYIYIETFLKSKKK